MVAVRLTELIALATVAVVAIACLKHRIDYKWFVANDFPAPITASAADRAKFFCKLLVVAALGATAVILLVERLGWRR